MLCISHFAFLLLLLLSSNLPLLLSISSRFVLLLFWHHSLDTISYCHMPFSTQIIASRIVRIKYDFRISPFNFLEIVPFAIAPSTCSGKTNTEYKRIASRVLPGALVSFDIRSVNKLLQMVTRRLVILHIPE